MQILGREKVSFDKNRQNPFGHEHEKHTTGERKSGKYDPFQQTDVLRLLSLRLMYSPRKRALPAPPPVRFPKRKPLFLRRTSSPLTRSLKKAGVPPSIRFYDRPLDAQSGNALHPSRGENRKNVVVAMMRQKCTEKTGEGKSGGCHPPAINKIKETALLEGSAEREVRGERTAKD